MNEAPAVYDTPIGIEYINELSKLGSIIFIIHLTIIIIHILSFSFLVILVSFL